MSDIEYQEIVAISVLFVATAYLIYWLFYDNGGYS